MSTTMENIQILPEKPAIDHHSNVDTSRPFSSVKEAVAVFGERFLAREIYSQKPEFTFHPIRETSPASPQISYHTSWTSSLSTPSKEGDNVQLLDTLKKLETELEDTKIELKLLKERESETEVALATLNAEVHKNMSKIAQAEANAAGKAVVETRSSVFGGNGGNGWEERRRDLVVRVKGKPTLAQILGVGDKEGLYTGQGKEREKMMKKKPIIPLLGDLCWRKKRSSTTLQNSLYSSPYMHLN